MDNHNKFFDLKYLLLYYLYLGGVVEYCKRLFTGHILPEHVNKSSWTLFFGKNVI